MLIRYPALDASARVENKLDYHGTDANEPRYAIDRQRRESQRKFRNAMKSAGIVVVILVVAAMLLFTCIVGGLPDFRGAH